MSFLPSPDNLGGGSAPFRPLLAKELRDLFAGRAVWVLLLLLSPLAGYSFIQAVSLYAEPSRSAAQFPEIARGLSPFDGIAVPTFGALYLAATLLFPFVAIRSVGAEKENGGLKLLLQTPYGIPTLIGAKLIALSVAWMLVLVPGSVIEPKANVSSWVGSSPAWPAMVMSVRKTPPRCHMAGIALLPDSRSNRRTSW